jgi:hypothetical protein
MSDTEALEVIDLSPSTPERKPDRFLTYPGRVNKPHPHQPKGPNVYQENLWPVTYCYNSTEDVTRIGFSVIAPPKEELEEGLRYEGMKLK